MHRKQIRRWHKLLSASAAIVSFISALVMAPASATTAPAVDMFWADVSRTNQPSVTFYLMTSVTVKNIEASDFTVIGSATGCTVDENFSQSSFHVVTLQNCSDGSAAVQLGANSISDLNLNWGPTIAAVSDFVMIDSTPPSFVFDSSPATVSDASFNISALASEQVSLVDELLRPTVTGTGCNLAGISVASQTYIFAINECSANAEVQVTIYANSYRDATGNLGPTANLTSEAVRVQLAPAIVAEPLPTPTPTPLATATPEATATPSQTPSPEPTVLAAAPVEPPAPQAPPTQPSEPELELTAEAEPVVPWASIKPAPTVVELEPKSAPRGRASVEVAEPTAPIVTLQMPEARVIESQSPVFQPQAPRTNFDWLALSLSVLAIGLAAVGGVLLMRKRLARVPRLRIA